MVAHVVAHVASGHTMMGRRVNCGHGSSHAILTSGLFLFYIIICFFLIIKKKNILPLNFYNFVFVILNL